MDPQQQFCLKWNSYSSNLAMTFSNLFKSELLADVTLFCGGKLNFFCCLLCSFNGPMSRQFFLWKSFRIRTYLSTHPFFIFVNKLQNCYLFDSVCARWIYMRLHRLHFAYIHLDMCVHLIKFAPLLVVKDKYQSILSVCARSYPGNISTVRKMCPKLMCSQTNFDIRKLNCFFLYMGAVSVFKKHFRSFQCIGGNNVRMYRIYRITFCILWLIIRDYVQNSEKFRRNYFHGWFHYFYFSFSTFIALAQASRHNMPWTLRLSDIVHRHNSFASKCMRKAPTIP